jgi:hypothetical protein
MNITTYDLKVFDQKTNQEVRLTYHGGECIAIYLNFEDKGKAKDLYIHVPRLVLENFMRLINES